MSGDCTESTLNFLFSGVLVGEIFLLKLVLLLDLSLSLKSSFFGGDSVSLLNFFESTSYLFGDNEGLFNFFAINAVCFVLLDIELSEEVDLIGDDFDGEIFFNLTGEVLSDFNLEFFNGEFLSVSVM